MIFRVTVWTDQPVTEKGKLHAAALGLPVLEDHILDSDWEICAVDVRDYVWGLPGNVKLSSWDRVKR